MASGGYEDSDVGPEPIASPEDTNTGPSFDGRRRGQHEEAGRHQYNFNISAERFQLTQVSNQRVTMNNPIVIMNPPRYTHRSRRPPDPNDQALRDLPPPEDLSHHFKEQDLERDLEEKFLNHVASHCDGNTNYGKLARKMKIDGSTLTQLEMNYRDSTQELIFQIMLAWKQRNCGVKVGDLVEHLSSCRLRKPALELKLYFSSIFD